MYYERVFYCTVGTCAQLGADCPFYNTCGCACCAVWQTCRLLDLQRKEQQGFSLRVAHEVQVYPPGFAPQGTSVTYICYRVSFL